MPCGGPRPPPAGATPRRGIIDEAEARTPMAAYSTCVGLSMAACVGAGTEHGSMCGGRHGAWQHVANMEPHPWHSTPQQAPLHPRHAPRPGGRWTHLVCSQPRACQGRCHGHVEPGRGAPSMPWSRGSQQSLGTKHGINTFISQQSLGTKGSRGGHKGDMATPI